MLAIKNYGLFWERKYVSWGYAGKAGHLKGYSGKNIVDFRHQRGVYVLYDKDMMPVYVGQAGRGRTSLYNRLDTHRIDHLSIRWQYFSWFGLCDVDKNNALVLAKNGSDRLQGKISDSLDEIEGVLILAMEPKLNRRGATWKGVKEYAQEIDEIMEEEITLSKIWDKQKIIEKQLQVISKSLNGINQRL